MPALRIRHLMIVVVYVAVVLAWVLAALRTTGSTNGIADSLLRVLFIPMGLAGLSVLILRPGPHRDWITAFALTGQVVFLVNWFTLPPLLFLFLLPALRKATSNTQMWGEFVAMLAICILVGILLATALIAEARWLIRRECPRCGRKRLLRALFQNLRRPRTGRYYRCGVCDHHAKISRSQYAKGCPSCGKHTLLREAYSFYWCLNCRARLKRLRGGPWEDAPTPADDGFYWLWTPAAWLRSVRDRIA
jgi:ribosomal protein L37AE/L43A